MQIVVTVTGDQGVGKSTLVSRLEAFIRAYPFTEDTKVSFYEGDGRNFSDNSLTFTVAPGATQGRNEERQGDRDTRYLTKLEDGFWYVCDDQDRYIAAALDEMVADHLAWISEATDDQLSAIAAILGGRPFGYDGAQPHFPHPGEIDEGAGVIPKGGRGDSAEWDQITSYVRMYFDKHDQVAARSISAALRNLLRQNELSGQSQTVIRHANKIVHNVGLGVGGTPALSEEQVKWIERWRDKMAATTHPEVHILADIFDRICPPRPKAEQAA